ncbi:MAG TPA: rod shape-determining protein MreC [Acetobacteraceae bacterium]|nr:rod shape-determining protein MreC [Acetobacteraceae bacterium]
MLRLSIQARQALARLTLPVLIVLSLATILLGRATPAVPERMRTALSDALAPIYDALSVPLSGVRDAAADVSQVFSLRDENARLRAENERLRHWYDVAMLLDAENATLKANLHWIPDPTLSFVTARVVADAGGVYARSVLLSVGPNHAVRKGQIALDANGLVGRVTEVGARSARVLLMTDINSRIPVVLEQSRARAILVGENSPYPRLMFLPEGVHPAEGERVVTSAEANAFPAGLLVGTVHYGSTPQPELDPAANLERLEIVRIFDYGLGGIVPPEAPGRAAVAGAPD